MLHFTKADLDVSRADLSGFCLVHFEELIHSRLCERFSCRLTPGLYNAAGLRAVTKGQVDKTWLKSSYLIWIVGGKTAITNICEIKLKITINLTRKAILIYFLKILGFWRLWLVSFPLHPCVNCKPWHMSPLGNLPIQSSEKRHLTAISPLLFNHPTNLQAVCIIVSLSETKQEGVWDQLIWIQLLISNAVKQVSSHER